MKQIKLLLPYTYLLLLVLFWALAPVTFRSTYSNSERRLLQTFPEWNLYSMGNSSYPTVLERALKDHIYARDFWRTLDTSQAFYLYGRLQHHDYILSEGHLAKISYGSNQASLQNAAEHFTLIYNQMLKGTKCHCYLGVIPEKTWYLNGPIYPRCNPNEVTHYLSQELPQLMPIYLTDTLTLASYYRTDPHWRQEALLPVAERLQSAMHCKVSSSLIPYDSKTADTSFVGAYSGSMGWFFMKESLNYSTSLNWDCIEIYDPVKNRRLSLYDHSALAGRDPYSFFLYGNQPVLTLINPAYPGDEELVLFRDSYSSSLAPLLLSSYHRITLIDTRYLSASSITDYVSFQDQDVLFLYSTLLLNDSSTLKD